MMTRLMTWFIELQNRFNELKLFKTLTIYVLNWVDDLISWHKIMQTTRREIDSFVARKTFKYNDVIDSKIVNLDIWCHFRLLDELNRELESNFDSRLISSWVRRFNSSNRVESECRYENLTWWSVYQSLSLAKIALSLTNEARLFISWICWSLMMIVSLWEDDDCQNLMSFITRYSRRSK